MTDNSTESEADKAFRASLATKGIRELKKIAKQHAVKRYGSMDIDALIDSIIAKRVEDREDAQFEVDDDERIADGDLTYDEIKAGQQRDEARDKRLNREALERIASAGKSMAATEEKLSAVRAEMNSNVKDANATFSGSMEAPVDMKDEQSVLDKLVQVTMSWQEYQDMKAKKIEEEKPLKEALRDARAEFREAVENVNQLGIDFG